MNPNNVSQNPSQVMSPELRAAMAARQQGGAPTPQASQMSPTAPGGQQTMTPPVGADSPQAMPGNSTPMQKSSSESEVIVKALDQRLKSISKVQEAHAPQPPTMSEAPVGGGMPPKASIVHLY